jgi:uncharacterized HAD superfamily protein
MLKRVLGSLLLLSSLSLNIFFFLDREVDYYPMVRTLEDVQDNLLKCYNTQDDILYAANVLKDNLQQCLISLSEKQNLISPQP